MLYGTKTEELQKEKALLDEAATVTAGIISKLPEGTANSVAVFQIVLERLEDARSRGINPPKLIKKDEQVA